MSDDFRKETFDIIQRLTGDKNVVVIPRLFVQLLEGDYIAAAILNQIVYWTDHTKDPEGWFYKSYEEWTTETGLSKYQVNRAVKGDKRTKGEKTTLQKVGVETMVRKTPKGAPTVHYRINREVFISALVAAVTPETSIVNVVDYPKVNNVDDGKLTLLTIDSEQSQRTSTTETTTETIKDSAPTSGARKPRASKPDAIPALAMNPMKDRITELFNLSWDSMTDGEKGVVQTAARQLCKAQRTPEDATRIYAYCKRKFENFSPMALTTNASAALRNGSGSNSHTPPIHHAPDELRAQYQDT